VAARCLKFDRIEVKKMKGCCSGQIKCVKWIPAEIETYREERQRNRRGKKIKHSWIEQFRGMQNNEIEVELEEEWVLHLHDEQPETKAPITSIPSCNKAGF
jgi:hypothetical protein